MRRSFQINGLILFIALAVNCTFQSCKDDVFNPEIVKATYQDKFPVKDVDPQHDWKLTRQVTVDVSVFEDYGTDYTVEIYDRNPFETDTIPHLLARGIANQDLAFRTVIDCPSIFSTLYVTRVDPAGRRLMKPVFISDNQLTTSFGTRPVTRVTTRNDATGSEVVLQTLTRPYTDTEIEEMLAKAVEYDGQDMDKNLTGEMLFKITGYYKGGINHGGSLTPQPRSMKLIVAPEAKWEISSPQVINQGLEIIVASKGEIKLKPGSQWEPAMKFTNTSSLVVLGSAYQEDEADNIENTRGKISGNGWIEFSNGGTNYSAGDIDIDGINNNGGTFFNYGEIDIKDLIGPSTGSLYVNHGDIEADKIGADESTGPLIENSCKIDAHTHLASKGIKMGPGARIKCKHLYAYGYIDLSANSMIEVENNSKFFYCNITGPTAEKSYALLKLEHVSAAEWRGTWKEECTEGYLINNIYCEYKEKNSDWDFTNSYLNGKAGGHGSKGNGNAVLCRHNEAPAYIPAGRCTGEGNTPNEEGGDVPEVLTTHTYAFEDNFPLVGDYDFNDVVLDVTIDYNRDKQNNIQSTHLSITLTALGASKKLGAGLRIVGLPENVISDIQYGGEVTRFRKTLANSLFGTDTTEPGNAWPTLPLFGDGHAVFDNVPAGSLVNTGSETGLTAQPYTLEITLIQSDQSQSLPIISKENLDFFIGYQYKLMKPRMEVHLYEYWKYGATAAGTIEKTNLDLAGNNTWAICVPNFGYPKERINISDQKDESNCAYPDFLGWARDRNLYTDWYLNPIKENLYRQPQE